MKQSISDIKQRGNNIKNASEPEEVTAYEEGVIIEAIADELQNNLDNIGSVDSKFESKTDAIQSELKDHGEDDFYQHFKPLPPGGIDSVEAITGTGIYRAGGTVYIANYDGLARSGTQIRIDMQGIYWRPWYGTPAAWELISPALDDFNEHVGSNNAHIRTIATDSELDSANGVNSGGLYIDTWNNYIYLIDFETGFTSQIRFDIAAVTTQSRTYSDGMWSEWKDLHNYDEFVKNGDIDEKLEDIEGIGYRETSIAPAFNNIITEFDYKYGYTLKQGVEIVSTESYGYNQVFIPCKPDTAYKHTNNFNPCVQFYDEDRKYLSQISDTLISRTFTTPAKCAFLRYNINFGFNYGEIYIYEIDDVTITSGKLSVMVNVGDIAGAVKTDAELKTGSIIPANLLFEELALDKSNNASIREFRHTEDYIPLTGGVVYDTNLTEYNPFMLFYDSQKRYIDFIGTSVTGIPYGQFTTPVNAAFCRFNTKVTNMDPFYIKRVLGQGGAYYIPNLIVPASNVVDLDFSGGEAVQTVPYSDDGTSNTTNYFFCYTNQYATRGKYIHSVELNLANNNSTVTVAFCADTKGASILSQQTFTGLSAGKAALEIGRVQGAAEYLCFRGIYRYNTSRPNPVGGGIDGYANFPNADLCIGINTIDAGSEATRTFDYISLGDSITSGVNTNLPYSQLTGMKLGGTINNLSVSAARCLGSSGNVLLAQVNNVPDNFEGVITVMIGVNDIIYGSLPGNSAEVLAKDFSDLNADTTFAEAFRLCLETLLVKSPEAKVLVIPPLISYAAETMAEEFRQIQRDICRYYAIPYTDTYRTCTICPLTYTSLMPDRLHPNDAGHLEIARVLWGDIEKLISYLRL